MEETDRLDWGGTHHPFLSKITTWLAGALVGAVAVMAPHVLTRDSGADHQAPVVHAIKASCAVARCQLMHEREGVYLGPRHDHCRYGEARLPRRGGSQHERARTAA